MRWSIALAVLLLSILNGCTPEKQAPPDDSQREINNLIANSRQCFYILEEGVAVAKEDNDYEEKELEELEEVEAKEEKFEEDDYKTERSNHLIVNSEWGYAVDRACYDRSFTNNPCVDIFFNCPDGNCSSRNETIQDLFCGPLTASKHNFTNLNYTNLNYTNLNYTNFNYTNLNDTNLNDITNETTTMIPDNPTTATSAPTKSASVTFKAKRMPPDINQTTEQGKSDMQAVRILGITPECEIYYADANHLQDLPLNREIFPPPKDRPKGCISSRVYDITIHLRDQKTTYVNRALINTHGERIKVVFTAPLQEEFRADDVKLKWVQYVEEGGAHRSYWSSPLEFHIVKEIIQIRGHTLAVTRYFTDIRIYEVLVYVDNEDADTDPVIQLEERGFLTMPETFFPNAYEVRVGVNAFQENGKWEVGMFARTAKDKTKRKSILLKTAHSTFSTTNSNFIKIQQKTYKGNEHFYEKIAESFLAENGTNYLYSKQVHCLRTFGHFPTFVRMRWNNHNNTQNFIARAPARIPLRRKIPMIKTPYEKNRPYVMQMAVTIFGVSSLLVYLMSMTINTILTRVDSMRLARSKALDLMEAQRGWASGGTGGSHSKGSKGSAGYPRSGDKKHPYPYPKWKFGPKGKVYSSDSGVPYSELKLSGERRPSRERGSNREKRLSGEKAPKRALSKIRTPNSVLSNEKVNSKRLNKDKVVNSEKALGKSEAPKVVLSQEKVPQKAASIQGASKNDVRSDKLLPMALSRNEGRPSISNIKTISRKRKNRPRNDNSPNML